MTESLSFVLCIERNATCAQALLLCESIRAFGGRHHGAPIAAVSARPGLGVDAETRRRLASLDVEYVEAPLNTICPEYGSANRVLAAAWAESRPGADWIAVLDSDTVLLDELDLPEGDLGVRPVDAKGSASSGPDDPFDAYWTALAALRGVDLGRLPFLDTTVCGTRIRASYNGGLVVARREARILTAWADLFSRSVTAGLKPWRGSGLNVRASTGLVGKSVSEYWGSNQAALAIAAWSLTPRVHVYPDRFNIPLHLLVDRPESRARWRAEPPAHVHYHWLFTNPHHLQALAVLEDLGLSRDQRDWLTRRLPQDDAAG
jgi:hypothetical protein